MAIKGNEITVNENADSTGVLGGCRVELEREMITKKVRRSKTKEI